MHEYNMIKMQKVVFFYLCVYIKCLDNFVVIIALKQNIVALIYLSVVYFRRLFGTIFSVMIDLCADT